MKVSIFIQLIIISTTLFSEKLNLLLYSSHNNINNLDIILNKLDIEKIKVFYICDGISSIEVENYLKKTNKAFCVAVIYSSYTRGESFYIERIKKDFCNEGDYYISFNKIDINKIIEQSNEENMLYLKSI